MTHGMTRHMTYHLPRHNSQRRRSRNGCLKEWRAESDAEWCEGWGEGC